jgi:hypothetical protein
MIKINLLPAHILERQRIRSVILLVLVFVIIEAAILGLVMVDMKRQLNDQMLDLARWESRAKQVASVQGATVNADQAAQSYGRWRVWLNQIDTYHNAWADTLAEIARWIYAKVQVSSIQPSPNGVQIAGKTDSLESFRRAYLNILRSPMYSNVTFSISGVTGGWPRAESRAAGPGAAGPAAPAGGGRGGGRGGEEEEAAPASQFPAAQGALSVAPPPPRDPLPIGVAFACVMRPEWGRRLVPPQPPIAPGGIVSTGGGAPGAPPPPGGGGGGSGQRGGE